MRVLIFGTTYCDTFEKTQLVRQWIDINTRLNPGCDLMLVDTASPVPFDGMGAQVVRFTHNLGHLARGGQDGWGRAFTYGMDAAVASCYDYVVHIEGDSLFRLPVQPIIEQMSRQGIVCASVPVRGTKNIERDWVETGLLFFNTAYVRTYEIVEKYDWRSCEPKRKYPQCPEWHLHKIVRPALRMMPWSAERGDSGQINASNVNNYDWITHVPQPVFDAFMRSIC